MTAPLPGSPDVLVAAADELTRAAVQLDGFRRDVGAPVRAAFGDWRGTAAPVALARLEEDLEVLARASEVCSLVAPVLRGYAEEMHRAQRDVAEAAVAGDPTASARVVESVEAAHAFVAEDTARVVREATSLLPAPARVDVEGGNALDGLRKAGGDLLDEVGSTLRGAFDRVNVFSDRFGEAWSETGATVAAIATDPMGALGTVVDGVTAPIAESYRTGGVDEAAARGAGTIAAALLGGKGVTKLGKLVPDVSPAPVGPLPAMRRAPGGGLRAHEKLGGHALAPGRAHVGASDAGLLERLRNEGHRHPVSSYPNRLAAERTTHDNMNGNAAAIDAWLRDPARTRPARFTWEHGHVVGRSAPRDAVSANDVVDVSRSRVVLKKDPTAPLGYYVLTSFPEP